MQRKKSCLPRQDFQNNRLRRRTVLFRPLHCRHHCCHTSARNDPDFPNLSGISVPLKSSGYIIAESAVFCKYTFPTNFLPFHGRICTVPKPFTESARTPRVCPLLRDRSRRNRRIRFSQAFFAWQDSPHAYRCADSAFPPPAPALQDTSSSATHIRSLLPTMHMPPDGPPRTLYGYRSAMRRPRSCRRYAPHWFHRACHTEARRHNRSVLRSCRSTIRPVLYRSLYRTRADTHPATDR